MIRSVEYVTAAEDVAFVMGKDIIEIRKQNTGLMLVACDAEGKMVMDSMAFDKSKSLFILDKFNGKPVVTINL